MLVTSRHRTKLNMVTCAMRIAHFFFFLFSFCIFTIQRKSGWKFGRTNETSTKYIHHTLHQSKEFVVLLEVGWKSTAYFINSQLRQWVHQCICICNITCMPRHCHTIDCNWWLKRTATSSTIALLSFFISIVFDLSFFSYVLAVGRNYVFKVQWRRRS